MTYCIFRLEAHKIGLFIDRLAITQNMTHGSPDVREPRPAAFEAPAIVARFDDIAVVSDAARSAVVILGSLKTVGHSPKARFVGMMTLVRSQSLLMT